jgi:hypothetical protein
MESISDGLESGGKSRIELARVRAQPSDMALATIRIRRPRAFRREADLWLDRAERARRIALALSKRDAEIALAHAAECEAEAVRASQPRQSSIAA